MHPHKSSEIPVEIGGKQYSLLINYQNQEAFRASFNALTEKIFNLTFEPWYQTGFWKEKYIPYTLFDGAQAISNISISIMDFHVCGKTQRYIQLGAVETDEEYRHQGLNRFLMEYILKEWSTKCDFIYLFANPTVLEFYPKFGFRQIKEYSYFKPSTQQMNHITFEKVDMRSPDCKNKIYKYIQHSISFGHFSMQKNADLVMFYCACVMQDNVFYSNALDAFVVATHEEQQLHLFDIFCMKKIELATVLDALGSFNKNEILLGFTPIDTRGFQVIEKQSEDVLFIQNNKTDLFEKNKLMFPLLSHA